MLKNIIFPIILLLTIAACKDTNNNNPIPGVPVNINLNLNDPQYSALNAINGAVTINGGVRGIIVYRYGQEEYYAFDRNCTFQPNDACATVNIESGFTTAKCQCADSTAYQLNSAGAVISGPAQAPLKMYRTSVAGSNLFITN